MRCHNDIVTVTLSRAVSTLSHSGLCVCATVCSRPATEARSAGACWHSYRLANASNALIWGPTTPQNHTPRVDHELVKDKPRPFHGRVACFGSLQRRRLLSERRHTATLSLCTLPLSAPGTLPHCHGVHTHSHTATATVHTDTGTLSHCTQSLSHSLQRRNSPVSAVGSPTTFSHSAFAFCSLRRVGRAHYSYHTAVRLVPESRGRFQRWLLGSPVGRCSAKKKTGT